MRTNVTLNDLGSHFIPHCPGEVAIFPEFSTPQFLLKFGEFFEQVTGRDAFENPNGLRNRVFGRKRQEKMDMIDGDFHLLDLKTEVLSNLWEESPQPLTDRVDHMATVLGCPNQVVLCIINGMAGALERHTSV